MTLSVMTHPGQWVDGLLDLGPPEGALYLRVHTWLALMPLETDPPRPSSPYQLAAYLKKAGPRAVVRKIRSRLVQDEAPLWLGCGIGQVLSAGALQGTWTVFLAPRHPLAQTHVCAWHTLACDEPEHAPCWGKLEGGQSHPLVHTLAQHAGASPIDPWAPGQHESEAALNVVAALLGKINGAERDGETMLRDARAQGPSVAARGQGSVPHGGGYRLFGWGHYARTCIQPHLDEHLPCVGVHEVNPLLCNKRQDVAWSTSPLPPKECQARVWIMASFHHWHGALVAEAIARGIAVVVEKPAVTTMGQLERVLRAWETKPKAQVFTGFHRRHMALDGWLREDLGAGGPDHGISMHAVVHEISLPPHHWYLWEASGSRLLSNGCHWIDQFLWLNPGVEVRAKEARRLGQGGFLVWMELENGATFSLWLDDEGSDRVGVRELTQWSRKGKMARLIDMAYTSESGTKVERRATLREGEVYGAMYERFARRICAGVGGDTRQEFARVWGVMLELEAMVERG